MQSASGVEFIRSDTSLGCFQRIFLLLDKILILTVLSANWQLNAWSLNFSRLASMDVLPNWEILTALTKVQSTKVRDHGLQASNEYVFSLKKLHTTKNTIIISFTVSKLSKRCRNKSVEAIKKIHRHPEPHEMLFKLKCSFSIVLHEASSGEQKFLLVFLVLLAITLRACRA